MFRQQSTTAAPPPPVEAFAQSAGYANWAQAVAAIEAGHAVTGALTSVCFALSGTRPGALAPRGEELQGLMLLSASITELQQSIPDLQLSADEWRGTWTLQRRD